MPETPNRSGRRIRVIVNPKAGSKAGLPTNLGGTDAVRDALTRHGVHAEVVESQSEEDAVRLAREAVTEQFDVVGAAGGDGTLHVIAKELIGTSVTLAIVPLGSMMNVARSVGISRDLDEAAEIIAGDKVRTMDVGEANGTLFYEVASVGLSAEVFGEAQRVDKGEYRGLFSALRALFTFRPRRVRVILDDHESIATRAILVAVANGPYTGFGFTVAPDAEVDDGKFDVAVFRRFSRMELIRHFASIALGRRAYSPKVETYRAARVRIESASPLPARADATDLGSTPVECSVRTRALRVLVPAQERRES